MVKLVYFLWTEVVVVKVAPEAKGARSKTCCCLECQRWVLFYSHTRGFNLGLRRGTLKARI